VGTFEKIAVSRRGIIGPREVSLPWEFHERWRDIPKIRFIKTPGLERDVLNAQDRVRNILSLNAICGKHILRFFRAAFP
jgi:hypothetical protein